VIGRRALELGFESTIGIIHDGSGQLKPLKPDEAKVYFEMTNRKKTNYAQFDKFQEAIAQGRPNDWRCRAGSRYLYICEDGLVHYCSQQRGYPGVPIAEYTTADVKREFLTAKSCAPNCTIGCVHRISHIDHWRRRRRGRFRRIAATAMIRATIPRKTPRPHFCINGTGSWSTVGGSICFSMAVPWLQTAQAARSLRLVTIPKIQYK
jgi:hypothetical protein